MPASNSSMIHKLQNAINEKFDAHILYNKQQWYSEKQNRPVSQYVIKKVIYDEKRDKHRNVELFSSCSQIQIVLWLRDYWYELNGWDIPHDNEKWEQAKELYESKHQPNDIEPVRKGEKNGKSSSRKL